MERDETKYDNYNYYLNPHTGYMEIYTKDNKLVCDIGDCLGMTKKELERLFKEVIDEL